MKKVLTVLAFVCFVFSSSSAWAASKKTPALSKEMQEVQARQALEAERLVEINDSRWAVRIVEKGEDLLKNGKNDALIFSKEKLSFENYFKENNLSPVGYSLVLDPNLAGGTWETFARTKEGTVSIRGDWRGTIMNGTIFEQSADEKSSKTYYFSSTEKKALASPAIVDVEVETAAPAESDALRTLVSREATE